jgi:hypothetical protein
MNLSLWQPRFGEKPAGGVLEREGLEVGEGGFHGLIAFCLAGLANAFAFFTDWVKVR